MTTGTNGATMLWLSTLLFNLSFFGKLRTIARAEMDERTELHVNAAKSSIVNYIYLYPTKLCGISKETFHWFLRQRHKNIDIFWTEIVKSYFCDEKVGICESIWQPGDEVTFLRLRNKKSQAFSYMSQTDSLQILECRRKYMFEFSSVENTMTL